MKDKMINTALLLVSILASVLFFEFVIAPQLLGVRRDILLFGFAATPHEVIDGVVINASGFTGDVIEGPRPPGTLRVLTLGGSTMFDNNFTVRLKHQLEMAMNMPVEVAGGALQSHTSASSLIKYQYYFKNYPVDYVFIYEGINDLLTNHVAIENFKPDYSHLYPEYKRGPILDHCIACRLLYNKIIPAPPRVYRGSGYASVKTFETNLRALIAAIRANGSTPILMTFAITIPPNYSAAAFSAKTLGYSEALGIGGFHPVELWGQVDYVQEGVKLQNEVIRKLASEYQLDLIDQEKQMAGNLQYFGDICHFSEPGVNVFISNISNFLASHRQKRSG